MQAARRDVATTGQLLELGQGEALPLLRFIDPRDAHAAQGQHIRGRCRRIPYLLCLEKHFHGRVTGQRLAQHMCHQLDERVLAVAPVFAPHDGEDVVAAFRDEAVAKEPPDEVHQLLIPVHGRQQEAVGLRAGVILPQQLRVVLGHDGVEDILVRPPRTQLAGAEVNHPVGAGFDVVLLVDLLGQHHQRVADAAQHLEQFVLPRRVAELAHPAQGRIGYALELGLEILVRLFIGFYLLAFSQPQIKFTDILDDLSRDLEIILNPVMAAPNQPAFPVFDIDHCSAMEAAVQLGIPHSIFVEVAQQIVVREFDLGDLDRLPDFCSSYRSLLLATLLDLSLHLCFSASHNVPTP